ncbi:cation:proton antiporter [Cerasicoccus frondis]|uniref:cation:proton antiporter n=1 Tax=Cerasicoccus frondis TaxID=490090 RepID=UPI002852731A|nr:cation:proton antiporter [Cerasicoccus frondis]
MEEPTILRDLTLVVGVAASVTVIFHLLRLPVILGYLLAGLLIGPYLPELPNLQDASVINQLSELGVVFLMFTIGLGFDLGRVQRVFWPALLAVTLQTALAFFIGMLCAPFVGYTAIEGVFLGAVLTNSSSMVCIRILREKGRLNSVEAQLAVGLLVFEDIVAVLLLVILGGVSVSGHIDFGQAPFVILGVAIFVVAVYFFGRMAAAKLTAFLKRAGSVELITLVSVALVLGVGWLASVLHLSVALGAFLAGGILAQSHLSKEIERVTEPLRDLFCAVFFVAIGMLINPVWIWDNLVAVLGIALLVVVGKLTACWLGFFMGGAAPEVGFRAALPKASVGEFGFILAAMGYSSGITGDGLTSMTVGLAITTYLIMPFFNAKPDRLFHTMANRCPDVLKRATRIYASMLDAVGRYIGRSAFFRLARRPLMQVVFYFLVLNSIIASAYLGSHLLENWEQVHGFEDITQMGVWIVAAGLCLPFLTAILRNLDVLIMLVTESVIGESRDRQTLLGGMKNLFHTLLLCVVLVLFGGLYLSAASYFFPSGITLAIFLILCGVALVLFWRSINQINSRIEFLFYQSFQEHSRESDELGRETALKEIAGRNPWKAEIREYELSADSVACGKELAQLKLRSETGAQVIAVSRGGMTRFDPSPQLFLFPGDNLILYGESEQVDSAIRMMDTTRKVEPASTDAQAFRIEKAYIGGHSDLVGRTLATSQLRKEHQVTVLGIQRGKKRIVTPPASELIQLGDLLLIAGRIDAVNAFIKAHQAQDIGVMDEMVPEGEAEYPADEPPGKPES